MYSEQLDQILFSRHVILCIFLLLFEREESGIYTSLLSMRAKDGCKSVCKPNQYLNIKGISHVSSNTSFEFCSNKNSVYQTQRVTDAMNNAKHRDEYIKQADVNVKWVSFRSHTERVVVSENSSDDSIQKNRNRNYRHIKSLDENQSNKIWKFSISVSCCRQRQSQQQQQQQLRLRRKNRTHIEFGLKVAAFKVRAFKVCVCVRVIHRKSILILGEK